MPMPAFSNTPRGPAFSENRPDDPTGRLLRFIAVDLIDPNPLAPREIYTEQMILERATDLREQGQHDAIHVIPNPSSEGRFIICDGWTRVQACREHQVLNALLAQVHPNLSLREAAWFGYEQNEGREQQSDYDRAMFYEKLLADGETQDELARRGGYHKSMLTYLRAYARLPAVVLDLVRLHPQKFGSRVAYELQRLAEARGESIAAEIALEFATNPDDLSVRWLLTRVKEAKSAERKPTPIEEEPTWPAHVIYASRVVKGYYKRRDGNIKLSLALAPEKRKAFAEALEVLLKTLDESPLGPTET
jgi:ParB family chromosome partitioning protein